MNTQIRSARGGLISSPAKEPAARTARAPARGPSAVRTLAGEFFTFAVIGAAIAGAMFVGAGLAFFGVFQSRNLISC